MVESDPRTLLSRLLDQARQIRAGRTGELTKVTPGSTYDESASIRHIAPKYVAKARDFVDRGPAPRSYEASKGSLRAGDSSLLHNRRAAPIN